MTTDTVPAELVTEEMIQLADEKFVRGVEGGREDPMGDALRAVAPLIAARAMAEPMVGAMAKIRAAEIADRHFEMTLRAAIAAERKACAKIAAGFSSGWQHGTVIAAAIRARGETT